MEQGFGTREVSRPSAIERLVTREIRDVEAGWTPDFFDALSSEEKAQFFYDLVITLRQARATGDAPGAEAVLGQMKSITEKFPRSVEYFSDAFTKARAEQKQVEQSPLFQTVTQTAEDITRLSLEYGEWKQKVFTGAVTGVASKKMAEQKVAELSQKLVTKQKERALLVNLYTEKGESLERVKENTDIVALESYTTLKRYHEEAEKGFAWLPSRVEINQKIFAALKNGRFPLLIGEPGTGKSEQADAVAQNLTGEPCVKVACTSATGEHDLILEKEVGAGTSYYEYGGVTQAFTGYEKSTDTESAFAHGRIVRLDEFLKINFDKSFGLIKEIGQKKVGEIMHRKVPHQVLPGSSIIATTNPAGARHHLKNMLPALEREFAEIKVNYLPMSASEPELYEFMLATLMDDKGYIALPKEELIPAYTETESTNGEVTTDGRKVLRTQELVTDIASAQHGALYRLANAVSKIQDSYVAHNPDERPRYKDFLLRIENGKVSSSGSSEEITLESSTLTLKEIASWMRGFAHRFEENNVAMHTKTFSQWVAYKADVFISQSPEQDREKLTAIFDYFGILNPAPKAYDKKPMTHLEIGYLSPRVPRPLIVEERQIPENVPDTAKESMDFSGRIYQTVEYLTITGEQVRLSKKEAQYHSLRGDTESLLPDVTRVRWFDEAGQQETGTFLGLTETGGIAINRGTDKQPLAQIFSKEAFENKLKEAAGKECLQHLEKDCQVFSELIEAECGGGFLATSVTV